MLDKTLIITVKDKEYKIEFGYGAFYLLSEMWGAATFSDLGKTFIELNFKEGVEPTFKQYNVLGDIVLAGIKNVDDTADVKAKDIIQVFIADLPKLTEIMQAFMQSLPTPDKTKTQGKQKRVQKV